MRNRSFSGRLLSALCLSVLLGAIGVAADPPANNKKKTADPAGTETYMAEFRAWFKEHANKDDNTIGKIEAAKAFGYSKPYDAQPTVTAPGTKPKEETPKEEKKEETETPAISSAGKTGDNVGKSGGKTDLEKKYASRPDYQFIAKLDKNGDEKVSQDEFEAWAHDYIVSALKKIEAEEKALAKAKQNANRRPPRVNQVFRR